MPGATVLVVEDDEDLVDMLTYNLNRRGYQTLTALDGILGCELAQRDKPDLVLLDIMLPGMDGWHICESIRKHPEKDVSDIPIIMLTALGSTEEKLKGISLGADDYIPKPFSVREVMLKVDRHIDRSMKKKQLKGQLKALEAADIKRLDFQNMLFHELKNQLFIIGGYSQRIAENASLSTQDRRECAGIIHQHSHLLNALTDEVLLYSRLETDAFSLSEEAVSLEDVIWEIIALVSEQANEKKVHICFDPPDNGPELRLNAMAVKLALSNILENAVKYSPGGSEVRIRMQIRDKNELEVEFEDQGPGISPKDQDFIFEKFHRGSNVKEKIRGTGLGLYISKKLVEMMGGHLGLKWSGERGSCFVARFRTDLTLSNLEMRR